MALLQVNYVSRALMRTVTLHVVLPVDKFASEHTPYRPARAFPTLYLLHGLLGSCEDWTQNTNIRQQAEERLARQGYERLLYPIPDGLPLEVTVTVHNSDGSEFARFTAKAAA